MNLHKHRLMMSVSLLPLLLAAPGIAHAQPASAPPGAAAPAAPIFTPQQLDQMLAPIALYPDQLLTQVLVAATYPQELLDAEQWLQDSTNAGLKDDALVAALQPLQWDPSVKSLVAFPQIIATMTQHIDWSEALGIAFANQQADTMAQIQLLRQQAVAAGTLQTTPQLAVQHQGALIVIDPGESDVVYVPVYNPATVYGAWRYSDYPPVYLPPPSNFTGALGAGIAFGVGFGIVRPLWGWEHPDWAGHRVEIDPKAYAGLTYNHEAPANRTWRHQGPVALAVPRAGARPPPAEHPPGTAPSTAVVVPGGARPPSHPGATPAQERQTPGQPRPGPAETAPPHEAAPAGREAHPPGPAEVAPPHEAAPAQREAHPPGPAEARPPEREAPHPTPEARPAAPQHAEPPHPPAEAHPAPEREAPHPAPEARPAAPPHPPGHTEPPHPAPEGHPAPPPHPAPEARPAPPPHPAPEARPAPPAKAAPQKPGEEDKDKDKEH